MLCMYMLGVTHVVHVHVEARVGIRHEVSFSIAIQCYICWLEAEFLTEHDYPDRPPIWWNLSLSAASPSSNARL